MLITVPSIRALIIDLHHHTRSHRAPVGGKRITLGCNVPALAAAFADAGDYLAGAAVDAAGAEVIAAGIGEIVGGCEASAMVACC